MHFRRTYKFEISENGDIIYLKNNLELLLKGDELGCVSSKVYPC